MPALQARDVIPIRFPVKLGNKMRKSIIDSAEYKTISHFVSDAVQEKLERKIKEVKR